MTAPTWQEYAKECATWSGEIRRRIDAEAVWRRAFELLARGRQDDVVQLAFESAYREIHDDKEG